MCVCVCMYTYLGSPYASQLVDPIGGDLRAAADEMPHQGVLGCGPVTKRAHAHHQSLLRSRHGALLQRSALHHPQEREEEEHDRQGGEMHPLLPTAAQIGIGYEHDSSALQLHGHEVTNNPNPNPESKNDCSHSQRQNETFHITSEEVI